MEAKNAIRNDSGNAGRPFKMKLENNWRQKTLENLEKDYWGEPDYESDLVKRCYELRKIPLDNFTTENLRIMIGQQIGLDYLIPLALDVLSVDLFAEGDLFEGDLLKNVLAVNTKFWDNNKRYWTILDKLIKGRLNEINARKFDTANFYRSIHRYE
ncbi:MAG: contact-dependent growth inhibition system immunity protein [Chitinophagales bacterium]